MDGKIQVAIKVRPLLQKEKEEKLKVRWSVRNYFVTRATAADDDDSSSEAKPKAAKKFQFDQTFNEQSKNEDVFDKFVKVIVEDAVYGCNGTIIAYGERNSGKTYTMLGTDNDQGIVPLSIKYMFEVANEIPNRKVAFNVQCFEIHEDTVNDLIDVENKNLKCMQSFRETVQVIGCKEELVADADALLNIFKKCKDSRRVFEADGSKRNDNSHVVLRINITNLDKDSDCDIRNRFSQLDFIDLAGYKTDDDDEDTCSEGDFHIDLSLSNLNLTIVQLVGASDTCKYIDYERCKLTHCLKNSIGGNSQTAFVCTISPASTKGTLITLWFATRANKVRNRPQFNSLMYYIYTVTEKINNFNHFVETRIMKLLNDFKQIEGSNILTKKCDANNCEVPWMTQIFISYKTKLAAEDLVVPTINIDDVVVAFRQLNDDFKEFHERTMLLKTNIVDRSNANVMSLMLNLESFQKDLTEKVELLETLTNVFLED